MRKTIAIALVFVMLLGLCACGSSDAPQTTAAPAVFMAGFARVDITPRDPGVNMRGFGDEQTRLSEGHISRIYVDALAVSDEEGNTALLMSYDLCNLGASAFPVVLAEVANATGLPEAFLALSCSHQHSTPDPGAHSGYLDLVKKKSVEAAQAALEDLSPATMEMAATQTESLNFVRHYIMNDGTYSGDNFGDKSSGSLLEIRNGKILNGSAGNVGGNIMMDGTAELIIHDGLISGGVSTSQLEGKNGANIYCPSKSTFEFNGGTITGGNAMNGSGGNLYLTGKMNMTGGVISGGSAKFSGGNVLVAGSGALNISGGAIMGGVSKGEKGGNGGGNIAVTGDKAVVNLYAGQISGGTATGLVNEDGTTTGGSATTSGAGVNLHYALTTEVVISGTARIYGNAGADVHFGQNGAAKQYLKLGADWQGNGTTAMVLSSANAAAGNAVVKPQEGALSETILTNFAYLNGAYNLAIANGNVVLAAK